MRLPRFQSLARSVLPALAARLPSGQRGPGRTSARPVAVLAVTPRGRGGTAGAGSTAEPLRPLRHAPPLRANAAPFVLLLGIFLALPQAAPAQDLLETLGQAAPEGALAERAVQILVLVTVLSLVPGLAITVTCFPFLVTVLAILRQGIGLQQSPPNMLIVALALFLTWFVMEPVFTQAWEAGIAPLVEGRLTIEDAIAPAIAPFRDFMAGRVDPGTFQTLAALRAPDPAALPAPAPEAPLSLLVPSFLLSEIARAFQVGFLIFLPFLIIDLVVAAVLMSMGMMMVPPAIVSLPFKLAFFALADGWTLVSGALVRSYF